MTESTAKAIAEAMLDISYQIEYGLIDETRLCLGCGCIRHPGIPCAPETPSEKLNAR